MSQGDRSLPVKRGVGETVAAKTLSSAQAVGAVVDGLRAVGDAVREIAVQRSAQETIRREAAVQIERIHAWRDVLLDYLDRSFDERRSNFDALFARLDAATSSSNVEGVARTLDAIVELAKSSPFKELADLARAKEALKDKSKDFEF
jgi:hypothetical protein